MGSGRGAWCGGGGAVLVGCRSTCSMTLVEGDPIDAIVEFFEARLATATRYGIRERCILDPGTGFAPPNWAWEQRYHYQKEVYTRLRSCGCSAFRCMSRPPWRRTEQHDELLELVVRQQPEFGRVHHPERVRQIEHQLGIR